MQRLPFSGGGSGTQHNQACSCGRFSPQTQILVRYLLTCVHALFLYYTQEQLQPDWLLQSFSFFGVSELQENSLGCCCLQPAFREPPNVSTAEAAISP